MENFDIEKLERKTPYDLPENTFEEMQRNVFQKIEIQKKAPIFNLKWMYAAAAVILLIVSANFIINFNKNSEPQPSEFALKTNTSSQIDDTPQAMVSTDAITTLEQTERPGNKEKQNLNLTSASVSHPTSNKPVVIHADVKVMKKVDIASVKIETKNNKTRIDPPTEAQIDEVLNGFSSSEIASLSNNSEQDVYLDLYN